MIRACEKNPIKCSKTFATRKKPGPSLAFYSPPLYVPPFYPWDIFLTPPQSPNVQFFAAHTIYTKIGLDWFGFLLLYNLRCH